MAELVIDTDVGRLTITERADVRYWRPAGEETAEELAERARWSASVRVKHPTKNELWNIDLPTMEDGSLRDHSTWRTSNFRGAAVNSGAGWTYLRSNWKATEKLITEAVEPVLRSYVASEQRTALVRATVVEALHHEITRQTNNAVQFRQSAEAAENAAVTLQAELDAYLKGDPSGNHEGTGQ